MDVNMDKVVSLLEMISEGDYGRISPEGQEPWRGKLLERVGTAYVVRNIKCALA